MGDDFSNRMLFAGEEDPAQFRRRVIASTEETMRAMGYRLEAMGYFDEAEEGRALVFGPPERWLFMGDTAGSTEFADRDAWQHLTIALSHQAPLIEVFMSDSCCVHIKLWRDGLLEDTIGNGEMPFGALTERAREELGGDPAKWRELLAEGVAFEDFARRWDIESSCYELLVTATQCFGWHQELAGTGYSIDFDGIFSKYDPEFMSLQDDDFVELHWDDANLINARSPE